MIKLYQYDLPLTLPHLPRRKGIVIASQHSFAEIAPLPGFSKESIADVLKECSSVYPSVQWGIDLLKSPLPITNTKVKSQALLMGTESEILARARHAKLEGFTHAKVKLGPHSPATAQRIISALLPEFTLRIDLNRQWEIDACNAFFSSFPQNTFDYIEEPGRKLSDLFLFNHPLAVDESLREAPLDFLLTIPRLKALIVKPTLVGGLKQINAIQKIAKQQDLKLILSSSFETGLGLNHLFQLTHHLALGNEVMGFDTYRYFQEDLLKTPLQFKEGFFYPQREPQLAMDKLCFLTSL